MSDSRPGPVSLARYRPILYLFTGVAAAYAILYVHNNVVSQSSSTSLRRRNAVRRTRAIEAEELGITDTPSYRAITHLEQLERQNGVYGTFRIETEDGRRVESGLLPSLLATRDQLMEEVGVPPAHAERMREMMEDTFLESFLALDFPSAHILPENTPERTYLTEQLQRRGISRAGIERALIRFNGDGNYGEELRRRRQNGERVTLSTSTFPDVSAPPQNPDGGEAAVDDQSVFSWRDGNNDPSNREGQNLLNLLYHIAEDQARRDGYIHRGVTCNSCGAMPIQGIRYRCANCIDYDLCETCEAMQVHIKTHLFYKVRIPAPFLGNPRQSQPVWYPGKPSMLPRSLPRPLAKRLMRECNFENTELDALWDQFRCLANHEWVNDPNKLHMAIDRKTFDRCFVPNTSIRPPPPSLIYDRMFAFYDTNGDNLIGFEEFLKGLASLNNKSNDERLRRVFRGYDIDGDGFVERKDFLRVFRAYYALSRELTRDMVAGMEDDFLEGGARDVILGSQPISSAFPGNIPAGEQSRTGEGKRMNSEGDMEIIDNEGILRQDGDDTGDRHLVVGDAAVRTQFSRMRPLFPSTLRLASTETPPTLRPSDLMEGYQNDANEENEDGASDGGSDQSSSSVASGTWPPAEHILEEDIIEALGTYIPAREITDPIDRARVADAVYHRMREDDQRRVFDARQRGINERWRRRAFYTDEEDGATIPEGYERDPAIDDSSDEEQDESESRPPSFRSRSSSKVRFQDDLNDDEYDVRSNPSTSSRSIPVGERWGGFEIPEVERDVGKEILYQVTQQGFNELLDILFKPKEDLLMEVYRTRAERKIWAREIELAGKEDPSKRTPAENPPTDNPPVEEELEEIINDRPLDELLQRAGYGIQSPVLAPTNAEPRLAPLSPEPTASDDSNEDEYEDDDDDDVRPTHLADPGYDAGFGQVGPFEESDTASATSSDYDDDITAPQASNAGPWGPIVEDNTLYYDPTLPQHRPDADIGPGMIDEADFDPTSTNPRLPAQLRLQPAITSLPAPSSPHSSPEAEATAPKLPPSPMQPLPPPHRANDQSHEAPAPRRPSPRTLARWVYLDQVERENKERGNGARLNFEEFSRRMAADRGRRLAFVASWIEMASF
ncbi:Recoverin [Penicillium cf. griseofulvum]|uniref:Recoverin n=1 Tax=Penicillium cf. griseofulvum TaxID=2972120 RepID=A0A9W9IUB5_9EURO|nr:Recoverin [Penicillium cf. griseofulvum]KAJ5430218.1 Recoverin [Penicillium cf. griseofulvum]KAJ5436010.1 Recoverin [Penicillium cf. griseofulvum]